MTADLYIKRLRRLVRPAGILLSKRPMPRNNRITDSSLHFASFDPTIVQVTNDL